MSIGISYMGTKRALARRVARIVEGLPSGPFLDAFAGMSAVSTAVGTSRPVWTNDVLPFAAVAANATFCSPTRPSSPERFSAILSEAYCKNKRTLEERFHTYLESESRYLRSTTLASFIAGNERLPFVGSDADLEALRNRRHLRPTAFPYCLFTITYAGTFFGASQCIDLDSIRAAIDASSRAGRISRWQRIWALLALARVACRVNTSTGHFAQIRVPSSANLGRLLEKRRRNVWNEFLAALPEIGPEGNAVWRRSNLAFNCDALDVLHSFKTGPVQPAIIYADPPYSLAQYSRYYHVLDTLLAYPYSRVTGAGRYPDQRYHTPFSHTLGVEAAMESLVKNASALNAVLILSYPDNGLYCRRGKSIRALLSKHYDDVALRISTAHDHSTFGGPTATTTVPVRERVYVAQHSKGKCPTSSRLAASVK